MTEPDPSQEAWPPPPPAHALQCPRCGAGAKPGPAVQACACGLRFVLRAGPFLDRSLELPAVDPSARRITVRTSGLLSRYGGLDARDVLEGGLDPILGRVPMTTMRLAYRGVYTIAVWRRVAGAEAASVLLVPLPLTLLLARFYFGSPDPFVLCLLLLLGLPTLAALGLVFLWRAHYVRVVGARETFTIRFDRPLRRRRLFHDELMRRCGLEPSPIP